MASIRHTDMWWLMSIVILCVCCSADDKCPSVLPYAGCSCYEEKFQVWCNGSTNFSTFPDKLPDSLIMKIHGVNLEVLDQVPYPNVMTLFITNSSIRIIRNDAFKQLTNLRTLVLNDNPIGELNHKTFTGLQNVELISLENTKLYVIPIYAFIGKDLPKLEMLKLSNANLYDIAPHSFHMLHRLALLNISHNFLRLIPEFASSDSLPKLTHLDLSYNHITVVEELFNLHKLQFLFLHHNQITQLGEHAFRGLDRTIVMIDLSYNRLNFTSPTAFIRLSTLQSLYLNNNALSSMVWEELPWDNLVKLVLHDNPWNCQCPNSWMIESELITVHNNNSRFLCATPSEVAAKPVLSVPLSTFQCPHRTKSVSTTTILGFSFTFLILIIGIAVLLIIRCRRNQKAGDNSGGSTPISAYKRVHEDQGELILRT